MRGLLKQGLRKLSYAQHFGLCVCEWGRGQVLHT